jgi:Holliday junction resolvasome RuvABC endonuclease subunit
MNILTNDPSFTAWGWAVLTPKGEILTTGCIKTAPEYKKQRIRVSDDRSRRAGEITRILLILIRKWNIGLILSESPHGSQNASAAIMIGIVTGITTAVAECLNIPIEYFSEQDSKKCALGKKAATKDDMINRMSEIYYKEPWITNTKYIDEAVADSLAVFYCAQQNSQMLKMMKQ